MEITKQIRLMTALLPALVLAQFAATAASADFLGKFQDWEAHARTDGSAKVCYAASVPSKSEGKYTRRGDVFLLVSHRPGDKMFGFVSLEAGYTYGKDSKIAAKIGSASFPMFPDGGLAFAYDDATLVKAMIRGQDLVIEGESSRGTKTIDTFSLSGFTAAYKAASKACGVSGEP
jgi:invasion protein IalB